MDGFLTIPMRVGGLRQPINPMLRMPIVAMRVKVFMEPTTEPLIVGTLGSLANFPV